MTRKLYLNPTIRDFEIHLPDGCSINSMLTKNGAKALNSFIEDETQKEQQKLASTSISKQGNTLTVHNDQQISFETENILYEVLGQIPLDLSELRISLHVSDKATNRKHRFKLDLFDFQKLETISENLCEKHHFNKTELDQDLLRLTNLLEKHREKLFRKETNYYLKRESFSELTPRAERQSIEMLKDKNLLKSIDSMIEEAGIVGEEEGRLSMFIIASSYKMPYPMHSIIQGESGSGKSHLINTISSAMPQEDVLDMTRITPKSLYNYKEGDLMQKVFVIQDFDGLGKEAQLAFRELQSLGYINSSSTKKDRFGNNIAVHNKVKAHFSSLIATTKAELYNDNMSRSIVLGIDESARQTERIIETQNRKLTGLEDDSKQESTTLMLRNMMRVLKSYPVKNRFAESIKLPHESKMKRRLNQQFQSFVAQITLLHQFQRHTDEQGRLITTLEDVKMSIEHFFTPILLKIDELDSSTRQFFEGLKHQVCVKGSASIFTQRDIRHAMNYSKTRASYFFKRLQDLEYIQVAEGTSNRGYKYQIAHWDDFEEFKIRIKHELLSQLYNSARMPEK